MTTLASMPFEELLGKIAAKVPSPGGGAAASATGAVAAALAQMVVAYSVGKKSLAAHEKELKKADESLRIARHLLMQLAEEDAEAYGLVNELMRLPEGDARRARELPGALKASIRVPMAVIAACVDLLRLCEKLAPITNKQLHSDLAIAGVLAEGAARASRWNVAVNAAMLGEEEKSRSLAEVKRGLADAAVRCAAVERACGG